MVGLTVLVTDAHAVKSVSVVRALQRRGATVVAAVSEGCIPLAHRSRACQTLIRHPPLVRPKELVEFLVRTLTQSTVDVLLPLHDDTLAFLATYRGELEALTALAIPPNRAIRIADDKGETIRLASQIEDALPVPITYEVDRVEDLADLSVEAFPVVVKPRAGWGGQGILLASDRSELISAYERVHRRFPRPIVQQYVDYADGEKYQLLYLFDSAGVLRMQSMHRVLVEAAVIRGGRGRPVRGGSALQWASHWDDEMLQRGRGLLQSLGWRGFGFVECVRDRRDGRIKLLEINARLPGTVALPLGREVDFVHGACLVALGRAVPEAQDEAVGARVRHTLYACAEIALRPSLYKLRHGLDPRVRDSLFSLSDPVPFFLVGTRAIGNLRRRRRDVAR